MAMTFSRIIVNLSSANMKHRVLAVYTRYNAHNLHPSSHRINDDTPPRTPDWAKLISARR